jgi:hypothetical protein
VLVLGEVPGDPVQDDPDPHGVHPVDEIAQVVGGAEAAGRCEVPGHLVSPGGIVWMLHHREQLHVGEAGIGHVLREAVGRLAVVEPVALTVAAPGSQVHLVDGERAGERPLGVALLHPRLVAPLVTVEVVDDGGRARPQFHLEGEGIGLEERTALLREDLVLVVGARLQLGHEDLPDPDAGVQAHGVSTAVPAVEVAHHAHPAGGRRPDAEADALHAVHLDGVRPELAPQAGIGPLAHQVEVQIPEGGAEGEGVPRAALATLRLDAEPVVGWCKLVHPGFEDTVGVQALHPHLGAAIPQEVDGAGVGNDGPHAPPFPLRCGPRREKGS